jgi:hypothetical protein
MKVYFAFHFDDVKSFRANAVRNLSRFGNLDFEDRSLWEREKSNDPIAIRNAIDRQLLRTDVTCVLIGQETYERDWVRYEIVKSLERGNGILGLHINRIRDKTSRITRRGPDPLDYLRFEVSEDGRHMFIEELRDRKWRQYLRIPKIRNYEFSSWSGGNIYLLSERFQTYCFDFDDGPAEFDNWIDEAYALAINTTR